MSTKKFNFSGRQEDGDGMFDMPIDPKYFKKLPEGMEPQTWLRLKTIIMMHCPPTPVLGDYPISLDDRFWDITTQVVKRQDGDRVMYMLVYNYKSPQDEDGIAAAMLFNQIAVRNSKLGRGYDVLNLKYSMYDAEISMNVSIRLMPNPV